MREKREPAGKHIDGPPNIDGMHLLMDMTPDAIVVIDNDATIVFFSKGAEQMFGYSEDDVHGKNVRMLMPPPYHDAHDGYLHHYLETGEKRIIGIGRMTTARRSDGSEFPIDLSIGEFRIDGRLMFTSVIRDLSELRETEKQRHTLQAELAQVSRIASLGTFATSLAHELNQPLTAVTNYVEAALELLDEPSPKNLALVREALSECSTETIRAGRIIQRLREFIMRGDTTPEIASLSRLVNEATALALANGDGRDIVFEQQLDPACDLVLVVPVQIQQVLVNLLRNALEAMDGRADKRIVIASRKQSGNMVSVSVSDSGPGLTSHVADRLFYPFISTKDNGMGLGLSICQTIINAHGGKIKAAPSPLGGVTFTFTLNSAELEEKDA